ncbi:protein ninF [Escherichia albertii NBRC 107761 = DSM 17582]|uniref:Conserved domain protein n=1 Tax=Escherichia albertii (strain TW07627) TaxID=502347 RepID=A0ABC9NLZ8_ESCAT|nr:protein NinF [Escherichia albertii]EDS91082.1 conserved domain protein [Escherichia albertii TW07627]EFO0970775.1 protein ninF [Escherichia albertii]EKG0291445.1 protein ninF [Escherichia albertii]MCB2256745.1 protein ninF [Escherichia albertii]MCB2264509.1 protein ninF [Escherichia albertii]
MIDQNRSYEQESVERALTCANCCAELMSDPNSSIYEEEDDG